MTPVSHASDRSKAPRRHHAFWRAATIITMLATIGISAWLGREPLLRGAASLWIVSDPVTRADAIVVLSGNYYERPLVAADLYRRGFANKILVSQSAGTQHFDRLWRPLFRAHDSEGIRVERETKVMKRLCTFSQSASITNNVITQHNGHIGENDTFEPIVEAVRFRLFLDDKDINPAASSISFCLQRAHELDTTALATANLKFSAFAIFPPEPPRDTRRKFLIQEPDRQVELPSVEPAYALLQQQLTGRAAKNTVT